MARHRNREDGPPSQNDDDLESRERREALLLIGRVTAASIIAAVAPRVVQAQLPPGGEGIRWPEVLDVARAAISAGVDLWSANAQVLGGQLNGSAMFLPPGSLFGEPPFDTSVEGALLPLPIPREVASAIAGVAWEVWSAWAKSYYVSLPRAFPDLAAVPGPEAEQTPLKPTRLGKGKAPGSLGISADVVEEALRGLLGDRVATKEDANEIKQFARWYWRSFRRWFGSARLVNLRGGGPVPSFAPPYVPVGPVVLGNVVGVNVLQAQPFG
jgi:hypothetical protein